MDLNSILRSTSDRIMNWLSDNGVDIRVEYNYNNQRRVFQTAPRQEPERAEANEEDDTTRSLVSGLARIGAVLGTAAAVGLTVAAASALLITPGVSRTESSPAGQSDIDSNTLLIIQGAGESSQCTVCMEDLVVGDEVRVLPCFHKYHRGCIDQWLSQSGNCPVCKNSIQRNS
jgi:hypothetical protein